MHQQIEYCKHEEPVCEGEINNGGQQGEQRETPDHSSQHVIVVVESPDDLGFRIGELRAP